MTPNQLIILLYAHTGTAVIEETWARNAKASNIAQGYLENTPTDYYLTPNGREMVDRVIRTAKTTPIQMTTTELAIALHVGASPFYPKLTDVSSLENIVSWIEGLVYDYPGLNPSEPEGFAQVINNAIYLRTLSRHPWDLDVPGHPVADWQAEVQACDTRLGYYDWVSERMEGE